MKIYLSLTITLLCGLVIILTYLYVYAIHKLTKLKEHLINEAIFLSLEVICILNTHLKKHSFDTSTKEGKEINRNYYFWNKIKNIKDKMATKLFKLSKMENI